MGAYLSQPITDKDSSDGEDTRFKYGTTAMQGWRTNMEVRSARHPQGIPFPPRIAIRLIGPLSRARADSRPHPSSPNRTRTPPSWDSTMTPRSSACTTGTAARRCASRARPKPNPSPRSSDLDSARGFSLPALLLAFARWSRVRFAESLPRDDPYPKYPDSTQVAIYISRHLHAVFKETESYKRGDISQGLIDAFLAMDVNMVDISGRDELVELAGKGDRDGSGSQDISSKMRQAILARARANGEIIELEDEDERPWEGPQAGSTCVVAVVRGDKLVVANAGDSRAVLSRRGVAVEMSRDHKPMDDDERARIVKAGGFVQEGRVNGSLALSRAIGDLEYKQGKSLPPQDQIVTAYPELMEQTLREGDEFLVLACDGIWDVLSSQQCVDSSRARIDADVPISKICEDLADECMAPDTKGSGIGCDNMSVVIVLLKDTAFVEGPDGKPALSDRLKM